MKVKLYDLEVENKHIEIGVYEKYDTIVLFISSWHESNIESVTEIDLNEFKKSIKFLEDGNI
jgi:hypothetical protein